MITHTQYKEMARQNADQMVWRQFLTCTLQANIATFEYLVCYHALPGIVVFVDAMMSVGNVGMYT